MGEFMGRDEYVWLILPALSWAHDLINFVSPFYAFLVSYHHFAGAWDRRVGSVSQDPKL